MSRESAVLSFLRAARMICALVAVGTWVGCGDDDTHLGSDVPVEDADADADVSGEDGAGEGDAETGDTDAVETLDDAGEVDTVDPRPIAAQLAEVPGLTVLPAGVDGEYERFELVFRQPVDHRHPGGATFEQHMTLAHRSTTAPMVLMTEGYANMFGFTVAEVALLTRANQLVVEHRYYGDSRPVPTDWTFLDIEQAANDHHRIVEALRPIYRAAWLSTGYSKGGMTAVYHRRFFPDDVDGTVPYVAPLSYGVPDVRYIGFVDGAGDDPLCRERLYDVQLEALARRDSLTAWMDPSLYGRIGGVDPAFESVVLEVPFTFWQYLGYTYCSTIPALPGASDAQLFGFIDMAVGFDSVADAMLDFFDPYYYQAWAQLGFPDVRRDHVAGLLRTGAPSIEEGLLPVGAPTPTFDPAGLADRGGGPPAEGSQLLFVYGQWDPWTAGAFELGAAADSFRFVAPGGTHGSAIADLTMADRATAYAALARWTGVAVAPLPLDAIPLARFPRAPL
jgi:hypothetical protein